jgi:predicted RNA-binding Zn-ribbon protein involved in translation (DUF1610 family)
MRQTSFNLESLQPAEEVPSDCPMCGNPGVPNGPPIEVDLWDEESHGYEKSGFSRRRCDQCGFQWLI